MPSTKTGEQPALRTRDAYALGVGRGELAGPGWRSPYRGIHVPRGGDPLLARQRAYDAAELLPRGGALGGWAAAHLLGVPELDGRGPGGTSHEPVLLVVSPPHRITRRAGTTLLRSRLDDDDIVIVDGVAVTSPVRTAFDLGRLTAGREAVVALDALTRRLGVDPGALSAYASARPRYRGVPRLRRALPLVDPRSASSGESRLRLVWMLDAGLPTPEVNAPVSTPEGHLLGIADLLDEDAGLVGEYDGAGHRDLWQHTRDNAREEWLEAAGLVVVRATAVDVRVEHRARTVRRLLTAYRRGQARNRSLDRWVRPR